MQCILCTDLYTVTYVTDWRLDDLLHLMSFIKANFPLWKYSTHCSKSHVDGVEVGGEVVLDSNAAAAHALVEGAVGHDEDFGINRGGHRGSPLSPASCTSLFHFRIVVGRGQFNA